jgi:predicted dehydrogenase
MQGHVRELASRPDQFVVSAGFDPIPERRIELQEKTGARPHDSLERLLEDPDVELVDVANRSVDHYDSARAALEAGKLVLVEKPMCVTYEQASKLAAVDARLGGGRLFVRHNRRFDRDFLHLREIIASGILGEVYEVKLRRHQFSRRNDWQTVKEFGGGQLLNWGAHLVDHGLRLLGSAPDAVWSDLKRVAAAGDAEDHVRIVLRGRPDCDGSLGGRIVDIEISGGVAVGEHNYAVYGTRGSLVGSTSEFRVKYLDPAAELAPQEVDLRPPTGYGPGESLPWIEETVEVAPSESPTMWDGLYAEIRNGGTYPVRLEEALEVMRVIDLAREGTPFAFRE